jgi:hypothetical protein
MAEHGVVHCTLHTKPPVVAGTGRGCTIARGLLDTIAAAVDARLHEIAVHAHRSDRRPVRSSLRPTRQEL